MGSGARSTEIFYWSKSRSLKILSKSPELRFYSSKSTIVVLVLSAYMYMMKSKSTHDAEWLLSKCPIIIQYDIILFSFRVF